MREERGDRREERGERREESGKERVERRALECGDSSPLSFSSSPSMRRFTHVCSRIRATFAPRS
jgi:hypothetical protein